jgi:hypothetical protein
MHPCDKCWAAYSILNPQNSDKILPSSLANGFSYLLHFVPFITVTDFPISISFEMGLFGFFLFMATQRIAYSHPTSNIIVFRCLYLKVNVDEP